MEERLSLLEAESASTIARLSAMEVKMNVRFQLIEEQLDDLRRSKVGIELREEINHRFVEQKELMQARFALVDQRFTQVDQRFDDVYRALTQMDKRIDAQTLEIREVRRDIHDLEKSMHTFVRWIVSGQIGIALAILIMASKMYFG